MKMAQHREARLAITTADELPWRARRGMGRPDTSATARCVAASAKRHRR